MPGRSHSRNRCSTCEMYRPLCLCGEIPRLDLPTRVIILMHTRERKLTTNSAKLARLALPNSQTIFRGIAGQEFFAEKVIEKDSVPALLYPTDDAIPLTREWAKAHPHVTLIVPDGSWRQARKVAFREPSLRSVVKLKLQDGAPSSYRLRRETTPERISTFEAVSRALGILEGEKVQRELELFFLKMVERILWSRGKLPPDQSQTEIPPKAILASHLAGIAGGARSSKLTRPS